jgi:Mrp family chromosome partitioning ATPase
VLDVVDGTVYPSELARLEEELAEVERDLAERTRNDLQLSRLQRNADLLATRYQTAVERLNQLEPRREQVQPDARQITFAEEPYEPAWPNFRSTLALALPAALALAFVLALVRSTFSRQIRDGAQASRISQLPNLGTLPRMPRRGVFPRRHDPAWHLRHQPHSQFSEALRSLVTLWSGEEEETGRGRVLMVASGLPDEGKSTVAVGLAATAALDGLRVLLMDYDIHRHGATRLLADAEPLHDPDDPDAAADDDMPLAGAVRRMPGFDQLDLISFDEGTQLSRRLTSGFARHILPQLTARYDLIVLDTPPTLTMSDAVRLGALADDTLIVLRAGRTPERVLRNCVEKLANGGIELVGTVVNDVDPRRYRQMNVGASYGYY